MVGGAAVAGDRHVVQDRQPEKRLHVHVVRLRRQRIPEEEHGVDPAFRDQRAELGIAPERPGEEQVDVRLYRLAQRGG